MSSVRDTVSPTVNAGTSGSLGLSATGSLQPEKNIAQNNVSNNILSRIAEESGLYEFEFITEIENGLALHIHEAFFYLHFLLFEF